MENIRNFSKDIASQWRLMEKQQLMDEPPSTDEDDLAARAARGCGESFRHLFEIYYPLIHGYAWKLSGDSAAADDIAQQSFIKAASALRSQNRPDRFKPWIYRIALNTARDHQRAHSRYRKRIEQLEQPATQYQPDFGQYESLARILGALSATIRETVLLVFGQGLTQREAARVMECPESTVAWRISEARRILENSTQLSDERP